MGAGLGAAMGGFGGYRYAKKHNLNMWDGKVNPTEALKSVSTDLKPSGRGSTGRTEPKNLNEQLAMEEAMSNPEAGKPIPRMDPLTDPR